MPHFPTEAGGNTGAKGAKWIANFAMSRYFMGNTFDEATSLMPNNGRARLIGAASAGHAYELTFADMNLANASHKKGMFTGTGDVNSRAQFLTRRGDWHFGQTSHL